jgi:hypothetical protein
MCNNIFIFKFLNFIATTLHDVLLISLAHDDISTFNKQYAQ